MNNAQEAQYLNDERMICKLEAEHHFYRLAEQTLNSADRYRLKLLKVQNRFGAAFRNLIQAQSDYLNEEFVVDALDRSEAHSNVGPALLDDQVLSVADYRAQKLTEFFPEAAHDPDQWKALTPFEMRVSELLDQAIYESSTQNSPDPQSPNTGPKRNLKIFRP